MRNAMSRASESKSPLDDYLSVKDAANYLHCGRDHIYMLAKERRIEVKKLMGRRFVSRASLDALLREAGIAC
jgi:excisionase family DNA binding protein